MRPHAVRAAKDEAERDNPEQSGSPREMPGMKSSIKEVPQRKIGTATALRNINAVGESCKRFQPIRRTELHGLTLVLETGPAARGGKLKVGQ